MSIGSPHRSMIDCCTVYGETDRIREKGYLAPLASLN